MIFAGLHRQVMHSADGAEMMHMVLISKKSRDECQRISRIAAGFTDHNYIERIFDRFNISIREVTGET